MSTYGRITDEGLDRLRSQIGVNKPANPNRWNRSSSRDAFRHWAWGIGDDNPLWLDPDHAREAGYDDVIAPPTWLYSCSYGPYGPTTRRSRGSGLPGVHAMHAGDSWRFFRQVLPGEDIDVERELESVREIDSRYAGRTIEQVILNRYRDSHGEVLAEYRLHRRSHERSSAKSSSKYADIEPWVYSDEELGTIAENYARESPRGSKPISWSDVTVGEEIPTRQKGPLTSTSMITYLMGWGSYFCMTDRIAHNYMRMYPGVVVQDETHNVPDFPERAHWDESFVREIGFPTGYDIGTQRISWFAHLLTDWIGDTGSVLALDVRLVEPNWMWDTTTLHGRVTHKRLEAGKPHVDLELWGSCQRGRIHSRGVASVILGKVSDLTE